MGRREDVSKSLNKLVHRYEPTTIFDPSKYEQQQQHYRYSNYDNKNRIINNDTKFRIFNQSNPADDRMPPMLEQNINANKWKNRILAYQGNNKGF